jgi:hypothetical protein
MFYADQPLVPLRQFGSERLDPLMTRFVPQARNLGRGTNVRNPEEAEALVDAVLRCAADPAYDGRTFGVVVLQGTGQVDLIRSALLRRMSRTEQERRRLRVGTPPDFQGDERDVMFLSMVIAPGTRTVSLTRLEYQRRFNVAATRARDQVWLFHSVRAQDLRSDDLRHSYLTFLQSGAYRGLPAGPSVADPDVLQPGFTTLFEQQVYAAISRRGYQVFPHLEMHGGTVDLVVVGGTARVGVICEDSSWRGDPAAIVAGLLWEQDLRRAGWEFWRIRESEYRYDAAAALAPLWRMLARRGMFPVREAGQAVQPHPPVPAGAPAAEPVPPGASEISVAPGAVPAGVVRAGAVEVGTAEDGMAVDAGVQGGPVVPEAAGRAPVWQPIPLVHEEGLDDLPAESAAPLT